MTKLHLGCGHVYLEGYTNIDLPGPDRCTPGSDPEALATNVTDFAHYYRYPYALALSLASSRKVVADQFADIRHLPYPPDSVDQMVAVQVLEHFMPNEADRLLAHWWTLLRPGGSLIVSVPDLTSTARLLCEADTYEQWDWAEYLIYGSRKDAGSHHYQGFYWGKLQRLFQQAGFNHVESMPEQFGACRHDYPAIMAKGIK